MHGSAIRQGISAGLVAAAATTGALLGFGLRQGMPARPFNVTAAIILGDAAAGSWGFNPVATPVGIVLHIAAVMALGVVAALMVGKWRWRRSVMASVIVSAGAGILHLAVVAGRDGSVRALTAAQLIVVYLLITAGLVIGMRLARTRDRFE